MELRIALLISGGGTTAEQIILACLPAGQAGLPDRQAGKDRRLPGATPALVVASKPEAGGIARSINAGMKPEDVIVLSPKNYTSREAFGEAIIAECRKRNVNFVGQYGWLVKTPPNVIAEFEGMIVNQHPGPLEAGRPDFGGPRMYGRRVHAARLNFVRAVNRDFWTEATAHRVTERYDEGAVLKRRQVPILPDDTAETLRDRVLPVEYEVQIETLRDFAEGKAREVVREEPLIRHGEEGILEACKEKAIAEYPEG